MKTIRDNNLFDRLEKALPATDEELWETLWNYYEANGDLISCPSMAGGLDHVEVKSRGFYFYDIGVSGSGYVRDGSFVVRPEL